MLPIRLVDGKTEREGRVEIFYNSSWGSVCDTDWGTEEGDVVCRQLGFGPPILTTKGSHYDSTTEEGEKRTVNLWLGNIECVGSEAMLAACSHSQWGMANCKTEQEAGVKCSGRSVIILYFVRNIFPLFVEP